MSESLMEIREMLESLVETNSAVECEPHSDGLAIFLGIAFGIVICAGVFLCVVACECKCTDNDNRRVVSPI